MRAVMKSRLEMSGLLVCFGMLLSAARAEESPRAILQAAIKAHGGADNLAKTLTGTLLAKTTVSMSPTVEASVSWEENFELPHRYHRNIKGQFGGQKISMEYAITEGSGWIRQNDGPVNDYKGKKLPLSRSWNAILALLPACLDERVTLGAGGKEKVQERDAIGVTVSGEALGGAAVLYFNVESGLLVKSKKRMEHPLSHQEADGEVVLSDYKNVSGVQYPRRITAYIDGKKVIEMEITRIEFLKKLDDRLFEKP